MTNQESLKKYLLSYHSTVSKHYFLLKYMIDIKYLNADILSLFTKKSSEYRRLIDEYQKWIFLFIQQHNCDQHNNDQINAINKIFNQNLDLSFILQLKLNKHIIFLKNLLQNTKHIPKMSLPCYRYKVHNTQIDINA